MERNINNIKNIYDERPGRYIGKHKDYVVFIPLVEKEDGLYVLFEERGEDLVNQPGEICFPGGRIERGEKSKEAAVRETMEELEIDESDINIIAKGDRLHRYLNVNIYSFIGTVNKDVDFDNIHNIEVKKVHLVKLDELLETEYEAYHTKIGPFNIDGFPYEKIGLTEYNQWMYRDWDVPIMKCGGIIIWGITAKFLLEFLKRLR